MNTLITISKQTVGQETVQTVNARDLHAFLEVGKKFADWITNRINQYEFEERKDYIVTLPKIGKHKNVVLKEYHLTLDMAKELSMVERNEKGKQARRYFIDCEKKLYSQSIVDDTRFDLPSYWEGMNPGEKAWYLLGPIQVRLVDAFRVDEENRKYKALIEEARRVLESPVAKAA
ncbi:antA/AntB antirepressor family protein [Bartonella capreoli]|uniref:antA/AntB antirepressor family protein n=1 Tax=Bartonella capreoli TaxID=155192 RepID=UPI001ABC1CBA|nr:antA/AntB antirepressor family protein [Bartonella capreoli]